jgi:hypothetical protein
MGEMIRVCCKHCGVDREEYVGVGMLGVGAELCSCYRCRRLVMKKVRWNSDLDNQVLKCPYCRSKIEIVREGDLCPICGDPLDLEFVGHWD